MVVKLIMNRITNTNAAVKRLLSNVKCSLHLTLLNNLINQSIIAELYVKKLMVVPIEAKGHKVFLALHKVLVLLSVKSTF